MAIPPTTCGPSGIFEALITAGFSEVQAVGAMANAIAESSLNPEARARDTNGAFSNGLWQFNEASFPDSGKLITGNCKADITNQVGYLKSHISGNALNGSTGAEVAGNFAANFERCQGCQPGGSQHSQRVANAAKVQGWVTSGKWPTESVSNSGGGSGGSGGSGGAGGGSGGGGITPAVLTSAQAASCVLPLNLPIVGQFCLLSKSQARGIIGALLMIGGGLLVLPGLLVLAAAGLGQTQAGRAAGQAAEVMPTVRIARAGAARARPSRARATTGGSTPAASPAPAAAPRRAPVTRPAPAPRPTGTRADARGTSPEFRRQFLGESS